MEPTRLMSLDCETALAGGDRRSRGDRRSSTLRALIQGSVRPRRRGPRRACETAIALTDWHEAHWLAIALLILLLSVADAVFTLALLDHGALEANPVMAVLLYRTPYGFIGVKFALTALGVVLLTLLARARAFGRMPVGTVLYAVLLGYLLLVTYEIRMLHTLAQPWQGVLGTMLGS